MSFKWALGVLKISAQEGEKKEKEFESLSGDIQSIVSVYSQSDRRHQNTKGYVKITAAKIKNDLVESKGYAAKDFSEGTINNILNRMDYTLKKVRKSLPLKKIEETDAIFENINEHRNRRTLGVLKISIDVKDKVKVGKLSRGGYHREKEDVKALDKDQHWDETLVPLGILEIESSKNTVILGNSNETSDFILDGLEMWYEENKEELEKYHTLEIYLDNGPSVNSKRSQFMYRMMEFACITGLKIHLLYYPPYHSKYNPIERVWAAVEKYWNGTILYSVDKVMNTLKNVSWNKVNIKPIFVDKVYKKGVKLCRKVIDKMERLLHRNQALPKWDVWIIPNMEIGMLFFE